MDVAIDPSRASGLTVIIGAGPAGLTAAHELSAARRPVAELVALGTRELAKLGLAKAAQVVDGTVVRQRAAYPVYDGAYRGAVDVIREFIERELPNLQLVGRNGMHKYNNQDRAMMTGLMAARNIMGASYDLWRVNSDAHYLEEESGAEPGSRMVPRRFESAPEPHSSAALERADPPHQHAIAQR